MSVPKIPPSEPHPDLIPHLKKHGVNWERFSKRMTRDPEIKAIRSLVVTELHEAGYTWAQMTEITSFGSGQLRGYSKAIGCNAARKNMSENGARTGRAGKGIKKPALSDSLRERWLAGDFDFHKGRVRSPAEIASLNASWTPERRAKHSETKKRNWAEHPTYRTRLETFHKDPVERKKRSTAQAERMQNNPEVWKRGKGSWEVGAKCKRSSPFWVRSTFEAAAVKLLESDPNVSWYNYETKFTDLEGMSVLPDFEVHMIDGTWKIVEVKASWVLDLPPEHNRAGEVLRYRELANMLNVPLEFWTEKDVLHGLV